MPATSAVVLSIDRLGAGWLGPYGNTWVDTPNFNRLAARSVLCETILADSADLAANCRSGWTGRQAIEPDRAGGPSMPELATAAGMQSLLLTDEPQVAEQPLVGGFAARRVLPRVECANSMEAIEETELYRF